MAWQSAANWEHSADGQSWWACNICGGWSWGTAKKCQKCGIKKSYATTGKASNHNNPAAQQEPAGKIEQLVSLLKAATMPEHVEMIGSCQHSTAAKPEDTVWIEAKSRSEYSTQIKAIESALEQLPDTEVFSASRATLIAQREDLKRKISNSKPLAARIEGCRGAMERAQRRRQAALEALQLAQATFKEADQHACAKESELKDMEAEYLASAQKHLVVESQDETCLDALQNNMTRVLKEMESGGKVDQSLIAGAYTQMASLFQGLTTISVQCKEHHVSPQMNILSMLGAVPLTAPPPNTSATSSEDVGMASPPKVEAPKNINARAEAAGA